MAPAAASLPSEKRELLLLCTSPNQTQGSGKYLKGAGGGGLHAESSKCIEEVVNPPMQKLYR